MIKVFAAVLLLASCANKNMVSKETYCSLPSYTVSKNVDETWKRTLAYFNNKNIPVIVAEKSNEYIITAPVNVQYGTGADADVVLSETDETPSAVTARYKVKITQAYGQTTLVPTLEDISTGNQNCTAKSTGKLEKQLSEYVKEK